MSIFALYLALAFVAYALLLVALLVGLHVVCKRENPKHHGFAQPTAFDSDPPQPDVPRLFDPGE